MTNVERQLLLAQLGPICTLLKLGPEDDMVLAAYSSLSAVIRQIEGRVGDPTDWRADLRQSIKERIVDEKIMRLSMDDISAKLGIPNLSHAQKVFISGTLSTHGYNRRQARSMLGKTWVYVRRQAPQG